MDAPQHQFLLEFCQSWLHNHCRNLSWIWEGEDIQNVKWTVKMIIFMSDRIIVLLTETTGTWTGIENWTKSSASEKSWIVVFSCFWHVTPTIRITLIHNNKDLAVTWPNSVKRLPQNLTPANELSVYSVNTNNGTVLFAWSNLTQMWPT